MGRVRADIISLVCLLCCDMQGICKDMTGLLGPMESAQTLLSSVVRRWCFPPSEEGVKKIVYYLKKLSPSNIKVVLDYLCMLVRFQQDTFNFLSNYVTPIPLTFV